MADAAPVSDEDFQAACEAARKLTGVSSDDQLVLYGNFKRIKSGADAGARPGLMDPKGRAKWDGWNACKDKSEQEAKNDYVARVKKLQGEA